MVEFTSFFETILTDVASFLLSPPIIYFVGCFLLLFAVHLFKAIIR